MKDLKFILKVIGIMLFIAYAMIVWSDNNKHHEGVADDYDFPIGRQ